MKLAALIISIITLGCGSALAGTPPPRHATAAHPSVRVYLVRQCMPVPTPGYHGWICPMPWPGH